MHHRYFAFRFGYLALALWCVAALARAEVVPPPPLPPPQGEVVLRVSGAISVRNDKDEAAFDLTMLQALGPVTITTSTLWTDGEQVFTGVPLRAVLDRVGATGATIDAQALNDYRVEIPVSDALEGEPILAYAQNDVPLTVRDMGPLWVIYPYDASVAYQNEMIYARSIWQLQRMIVRP